jgi:hypothetical protein
MGRRKKVQYAPSTVTQSRCGAWAPTTRRKFWKYSDKTPWADVSVEGVCTQVHRSFIEYCLSESQFNRKLYADGSLGVVFIRRAMLRLLGTVDPGECSYGRLDDICEDLRIAKLTVKKRDGSILCDVTEGIISRYSHVYELHPDGTVKKYLGFGVRITASYMETFARDVAVHSERHTKAIVAIPSGAVQAIVRFLLTHEVRYHGTFDVVAKTVGLVGTDALKRARQDLVKFASVVAAMGIVYDEKTKMLAYERLPDVWFENPPVRNDRVSARRAAKSAQSVHVGGRIRAGGAKGAVKSVGAGG